MNKIEKFLRKLNKKEREALVLLIFQINKDPKKIPGVKKLKGKNQLYRIRFGKYRIVFQVEKTGAEIKKITKRDDSTYKNL